MIVHPILHSLTRNGDYKAIIKELSVTMWVALCAVCDDVMFCSVLCCAVQCRVVIVLWCYVMRCVVFCCVVWRNVCGVLSKWTGNDLHQSWCKSHRHPSLSDTHFVSPTHSYSASHSALNGPLFALLWARTGGRTYPCRIRSLSREVGM